MSKLKLMVLNRDHRLVTRYGHTIGFKKGEPVYVPPMIQKEALAIGATFEDGTIPEITDETPKGGRPADPDKVTGDIRAAIELIVLRNDREDFSASGLPKADAGVKEIGYRVSQKDVNPIWSAINAEKNA